MDVMATWVFAWCDGQTQVVWTDGWLSGRQGSFLPAPAMQTFPSWMPLRNWRTKCPKPAVRSKFAVLKIIPTPQQNAGPFRQQILLKVRQTLVLITYARVNLAWSLSLTSRRNRKVRANMPKPRPVNAEFNLHWGAVIVIFLNLILLEYIEPNAYCE